MKNLFLTLVSIFAFAFVAQAQSASDVFEQALSDLVSFDEDPSATGLVEKAATGFSTALADADFAANPNNWLNMGDTYTSLADNQMTAKLINPEATLYYMPAAVKAFEAYKGALNAAQSSSEKKYNKKAKNAIEKIQEIETNLNNFAIEAYKAQDFANSNLNFAASVEAYDLLGENGKESRLDDEALLKDQLLFTALTATYGENAAGATPYYERLYDMGSDDPAVYEGLYKAYEQSNPEKALNYLSEGIEKFPDATNLLFTQINYYLTQGETGKLIEKLELAIEKEPDNVSVITTLGSVYDQLSVAALGEGDTEKSDEHFGNAKKYYELAVEKDPSNFNGYYSIGALYYNKAAAYAPQINALADDFSAEGTKKYETMKLEMDGIFAEALPYFQKADELNSEDRNTIIALKEIYARQNQFDMVEKYSAKLESIENK